MEAKKINCFVAVDVETTGLSPKYHELIEVSAVKYQNNKKKEIYTSLIKPVNPIPPVITQITGITNEMVEDAPGVKQVMDELVAFIQDLPIVAHNASFDLSFLQNYSRNQFCRNTIIDTVILGRRLYPYLPNHKLATIAKHMGITEEGFHRAQFDCECCAKIYLNYQESC